MLADTECLKPWQRVARIDIASFISVGDDRDAAVL